MEKGKGQCYDCKYLDRYFTKGIKQFNKTGYGWCCSKCCTVTVHDSCNNYKYRDRQKRSKLLIRYYLNDLLTEISAIRTVIEAQNDDETVDDM